VEDLQQAGHLVRLEEEVDAYLEAAEIHRRVYRSGGPAIYFARVAGCRFPMVSNLFGTMGRTRYLFRDTLEHVRRLVELKIEPARLPRQPTRYMAALLSARAMRPRWRRSGPVTAHTTTVSQLPQLQCWPRDGGAFVTLPLVYSEDVERPGWARSNLGMYRVQLSGGQYQVDREVGLHYQIHRGIGVHHAAAIRQGQPFRVNVFVGGAPAMMVAAVMPLPEGMSELGFAGALGGHRIALLRRPGQLPLYAEADFCLSGIVQPDRLLPEGPFGDHLGYYSLAHDFPVLQVQQVYHREGAIWPFTVVGRPPQEDTNFGALIHELTGPIIPQVLPGVRGVHAVDAAGVHPLLLAIGSERYVPYRDRHRPQELLTQAHAILGQGQLSLAKYLMIIAAEDAPGLDIHDIDRFLQHLLRRVDWNRDVHLQTCTTVDTLDYTGTALNEGSKVVIAAVGPARRELPTELPSDLQLPAGFDAPRVCLPGVLAVQAVGRGYTGPEDETTLSRFCSFFRAEQSINRFPLICLVDDSEFTARNLDNFLWVTFTRSDPASDIDGIEALVQRKHWGCRGALVIDARRKPHHAPPLIEDPQTVKRVDAMAARGGPLAKWL
jgi:4-hydroxy-3-polyprenylbenzoate decarboxylase